MNHILLEYTLNVSKIKKTKAKAPAGSTKCFFQTRPYEGENLTWLIEIKKT